MATHSAALYVPHAGYVVASHLTGQLPSIPTSFAFAGGVVIVLYRNLFGRSEQEHAIYPQGNLFVQPLFYGLQ